MNRIYKVDFKTTIEGMEMLVERFFEVAPTERLNTKKAVKNLMNEFDNKATLVKVIRVN